MLAGLGCLLSVDLFAAGMAEQSQCFKAVYRKSASQGFYLEDSKLVVIPATEDGKKGFFAYTDKSSYFCQLPPSKPIDKEDRFNFFGVEINVEDKPVQISYYEAVAKDAKTSIVGADKNDKSTKYQPISCTAILSEKTKDLLTKQIKKMVPTVYDTYNRRLSKHVSNQKAEVKYEDYMDALAACENNSELRGAVNDEMSKFTTIYGSKYRKSLQGTKN